MLSPQRPLTRYLPIRYDDESSADNQTTFDLRAHIESAGHQLDDDNGVGVDRHFWIDSTSCRGYLKKLSGSGGSNNARRSGRKWLKRWFVFDRQSRTLSYYRHRSDDRSDSANQRTGTAAADKKTTPRVSIRFQVIVCIVCLVIFPKTFFLHDRRDLPCTLLQKFLLYRIYLSI